LSENVKGRHHLEDTGFIWEVNVTMDLKGIGCNGVYFIKLA
jgi:hypothetical protein